MSIVFFTDRDLGKQFPGILREAGLVVERHDDHFAHNTPDEVWLAEMSRRGWIAITHNKRIRYTPNELAAIIKHRVALLVVIGRPPMADLARAFVATFALIQQFVSRHQPPYIAKVYRPSSSALAKPRCFRRDTNVVPMTTEARGR